MDFLTLALFCAALLACIALNISILFALAFGLALFLLDGRRKGFTLRELASMSFEGIYTIRKMLLTFVLIGILTAFWRAAGTISVIVCSASALIRPSVFLLMTFLLNCAVSVLTGTAFGTGATMGVICATMAQTMGIDLWLVGGAVLSGAYFGDRCSPVSTSALLVSELTGTSIYDNIRRMLRSALVPFLLSCAIYTAVGLTTAHTGEMMNLRTLFDREFVFHPAAFIPAAVILLLSLLHVNVRLTMTASIVAAVPVCIFIQGNELPALLKTALLGFTAADAEVGAMVNGGGIISMLKVIGIVCLSSSYTGIFRKTGLLDKIKTGIELLAAKTTSYTAMLVTSILGCMVACNQTLTIMLTSQLCAGLKNDSSDYALNLEDTAVVTAPLIPWSIACSVTLTAVGAPSNAILLACFLYLLPAWRTAISFLKPIGTVPRVHPVHR